MTTLVHVTATPYQSLGLVMLRVDVSGAMVDQVSIVREVVDTGVTSAVIAPAGHDSPAAGVELVNGSAVLADTTVPLDVPVRYQATAAGTTSVTAVVTVASSGAWRLGNPMRPYQDVLLSLATPFPACSTAGAAVIMGLTSDRYESQTELVKVAGRADPLVGSQPMSTPDSDLRLWTRSEADREAVLELYRSGDVLLLRAPAVYQLEPRYVVVVGVSVERVVSDHRKPWRSVTAQIKAVEQPEGAAAGWLGVRWSDLCLPGVTWADVVATGASWASLASGAVTGVYPSEMRTWAEVKASWATWGALSATGKTWAQLVAGD